MPIDKHTVMITLPTLRDLQIFIICLYRSYKFNYIFVKL